MTKASLKERIEGNELDLSLNNLTAIPVEELASIPKVMALDLSNNAIPAIPASFCLLKHLIRIDLSKNNLTELPANFGNLRNLKHLDLLGNQISVLPLSFCHLDKLQWLDLKDNPLKSDLRKEAGDCLDENQCRQCAVKVVQYMKRIQSQVESEKQKKLKRIRDDEIKAKEKEEKRAKETQEKRKRRKKEWEAEASNKIGDQLKSPSTTKEMGKYEDFKDGHSQKTNEIAPTTCRLLICSLFFLLTAMGIALIFIQPEKFFEMWRETKLYIKESATLVENIAYNLFFSVKQRLGIK